MYTINAKANKEIEKAQKALRNALDILSEEKKMIIYTPVYKSGARTFDAVNVHDLKIIHGSTCARYRRGVGFYGSLYDINCFFSSIEDVQRYWMKEPVKNINLCLK
jgi:hypothetical protein